MGLGIRDAARNMQRTTPNHCGIQSFLLHGAPELRKGEHPSRKPAYHGLHHQSVSPHGSDAGRDDVYDFGHCDGYDALDSLHDDVGGWRHHRGHVHAGGGGVFWDVGAAESRVQVERGQRVVLGEGQGYRRCGDGRGCERGSDGLHGRVGVAVSDGIEVRDYCGFERSLLVRWVVPVRGRHAEQERLESDCAHLLRLFVGSCRELRDQHAVERGAL